MLRRAKIAAGAARASAAGSAGNENRRPRPLVSAAGERSSSRKRKAAEMDGERPRLARIGNKDLPVALSKVSHEDLQSELESTAAHASLLKELLSEEQYEALLAVVRQSGGELELSEGNPAVTVVTPRHGVRHGV